MDQIKSVWVVGDYKTGELIGIYATKEIADKVANENIDCSTVPREMIVGNGDTMSKFVRIQGSTIAEVDIGGKTNPVWTDQETGEVHIDPEWTKIQNARRMDGSPCLIPRHPWWKLWE